MIHSLRYVTLATLVVLTSTTTAYQEVEAGPNVLDECAACPRMYTNLYKCQQIAQPDRIGDEVRACVCDRSDDGWYAFIDACRGCLPITGTDDFWGNLGRLMTATYAECRNGPSGNVTSDGVSLCASSDRAENCMSLKDSSEGDTWVSFRWFPEDGALPNSNRTQRLNLAAVKPNVTTSTTIESTTSTAAATGSDRDTAAPEPTTTPPTGTGSQDPSSTTDPESTSTTANTAFAARLSQGSQIEYFLGMLVVAGIVGLV
jgi:hypothetical protein